MVDGLTPAADPLAIFPAHIREWLQHLSDEASRDFGFEAHQPVDMVKLMIERQFIAAYKAGELPPHLMICYGALCGHIPF